ncbi:UNVERIFIED_CONTAM: hypothetical protein HDU68_003130 [Siphonaria sp. JEL0065]|nr:hypothetical protein HDU68_003130 [Siphonaria sp. JEL0065]
MTECLPLKSIGPCGPGFAGLLAPVGLETQLSSGLGSTFLIDLLSDGNHRCTRGPELAAAAAGLRYQSLALCASGVSVCNPSPPSDSPSSFSGSSPSGCPGALSVAFSAYALLFSQLAACPSPPTSFVQGEIAERKKLLLTSTTTSLSSSSTTRCIVATGIEDRCGFANSSLSQQLCLSNAKDPCCSLPAAAQYALLASNGTLLPATVTLMDASATATPAPSSSTSNTSIALSVAIVGGIVAALSAALFMWMRKKRLEKLAREDSTSNSPSSIHSILKSKPLPQLPVLPTSNSTTQSQFQSHIYPPVPTPAHVSSFSVSLNQSTPPPVSFTTTKTATTAAASAAATSSIIIKASPPVNVATALSASKKTNSSQILKVKQVYVAAAADELSLRAIGDEIYVLQSTATTSPPTPTPTTSHSEKSNTDLEYSSPISPATFRRRESSKNFTGNLRTLAPLSDENESEVVYVHPKHQSYGRRVSSVDRGLIGVNTGIGGGGGGSSVSGSNSGYENPADMEGVVAYYGTNGIVMRITHPYEAISGSDELTLVVGHDLIMLAEFEDGWGLGMLPLTGQKGAFPMPCVVRYSASSPSLKESEYE